MNFNKFKIESGFVQKFIFINQNFQILLKYSFCKNKINKLYFYNILIFNFFYF